MDEKPVSFGICIAEEGGIDRSAAHNRLVSIDLFQTKAIKGYLLFKDVVRGVSDDFCLLIQNVVKLGFKTVHNLVSGEQVEIKLMFNPLNILCSLLVLEIMKGEDVIGNEALDSIKVNFIRVTISLEGNVGVGVIDDVRVVVYLLNERRNWFKIASDVRA